VKTGDGHFEYCELFIIYIVQMTTFFCISVQIAYNAFFVPQTFCEREK